MVNTSIGAGTIVAAEPRRRINWGIVLLCLPALAFVVAMFVIPFLFGLNLSLHPGNSLDAVGDLSFANYLQFFNDPGQSDSVWITFQVALPVTVFSILISIPLAYYMRRGIRLERFITTLLILPLTLGNVMVAQSMLLYYGRQGWFNQALQALHIIKDPLPLVHSWWGVEIALFIQNFPFVFLMILGYMSGISPDLERASRMLGASAWRTFWKVIWPLILPGVAIAFCLNFVANFTVFPSAVMVGRPDDQTKVLSVVAFRAAYELQNPSLGTAIAFVMGIIEFVVVSAVLYARSRMTRTSVLGGGKGV
ncbi:MAG: ABC transporter permease subunit [Chloroflexota bacterium]